jgi:hypothetical protein
VSKTWKELGKFHSKFCKKLIDYRIVQLIYLRRCNLAERVGEASA